MSIGIPHFWWRRRCGPLTERERESSPFPRRKQNPARQEFLSSEIPLCHSFPWTRKNKMKLPTSISLSLLSVYSLAISFSAIVVGEIQASGFLQIWLLVDGSVSAFIVIIRLIRHHPEMIEPIINEICETKSVSVSLDMENRARRLELEASSSSDIAAAADTDDDDDVDTDANAQVEGEEQKTELFPSRRLLLQHQHFEISDSMKAPTNGSDEPFVRVSPHLLANSGLSRVGGEHLQVPQSKTAWGVVLVITDLLTLFRFAWTIIGSVLLVQIYKNSEISSIFTQCLVCGYLMFTGCFFKVGHTY